MYDNHPVVVTHCQLALPVEGSRGCKLIDRVSNALAGRTAARLFKGRLHLGYLLLTDKMV